jgi:hypothetical protein
MAVGGVVAGGGGVPLGAEVAFGVGAGVAAALAVGAASVGDAPGIEVGAVEVGAADEPAGAGAVPAGADREARVGSTAIAMMSAVARASAGHDAALKVRSPRAPPLLVSSSTRHAAPRLSTMARALTSFSSVTGGPPASCASAPAAIASNAAATSVTIQGPRISRA